MIYAVMSFEEDGELPKKVRNAAKAVFADYSPRVWFIDFNGTTRELTDLIWPDDKEDLSSIANGAVVQIDKESKYSGYASEELWAWLKVHLP